MSDFGRKLISPATFIGPSVTLYVHTIYADFEQSGGVNPSAAAGDGDGDKKAHLLPGDISAARRRRQRP